MLKIVPTAVSCAGLQFPADSTTADDALQRRPLHCLRKGFTEHAVGVEGGQPVAIGIGVVVTCSPAVTLDEGHLAEDFQTRARRNQRLG